MVGLMAFSWWFTVVRSLCKHSIQLRCASLGVLCRRVVAGRSVLLHRIVSIRLPSQEAQSCYLAEDSNPDDKLQRLDMLLPMGNEDLSVQKDTIVALWS
jgi:hypothetical protein